MIERPSGDSRRPHDSDLIAPLQAYAGLCLHPEAHASGIPPNRIIAAIEEIKLGIQLERYPKVIEEGVLDLRQSFDSHRHIHLRGPAAYSEEEEALETGGGIKKALPFFQEAPFFALNSDPVWTESSPSLQKMLNAYDEETMDILLLLWPVEHVFGHSGKGDYFIENGVPRRKRPDEEKAPFVYAGAQILHPRIFKDSPSGKFSLNVLYDKAERNARLSAVVGKGDWYHVGTPEALALAEQRIPAS